MIWAILIGTGTAIALVGLGSLGGYVKGRDDGFRQGFREASSGVLAAAQTEASIRTPHARHRRETPAGRASVITGQWE